MEVSKQKEALMGQILENTHAQTQAIKRDQLDKLANLIEERSRLMKQVDALTSKLAESTGKSTDQVLTEIIAVDQANQALMKKEFEQVKKELRKIRIGKQQGVNYGEEYGLYKEEGVFFDTKE